MPAKIIVIGGGASGLMAAGRAAACGASVTLLEKMPRLGLKLGITGKGRCNVTNIGAINDYVANLTPDGRFLINALNRFFHHDLTDFLDAQGVPTVVERGQRVFPASNRALDVVSALLRFTKEQGVSIIKNCAVKHIRMENNRLVGLDTSCGYLAADRVILATGGASYPQTGSTGDGFRVAQELGHTIAPIRPYLVPLLIKEPYVKELQGLALKNVRASVYVQGEKIDEEFGEMLFTHFGISGPIILSLSRAVVDHLDKGRVDISLCLKPALDARTLDARLIREFHSQGKRQFKNILLALLPQRLAAIVPNLLAIPGEKKGAEITIEERRKLADFLHDWRLTLTGVRPLEEAIVTAGGVLTREINPVTMESKKIRGLYFCGEIIDLQAKTGGYNLQMAFTTGWVAGESAATSHGL
ncbi:MAG: NAD(P)/FAD-dependent oxidoreductase [Deltaproteobacteria bacterium]|nr:MAG: NAD(P)/FAD-dependent oxidoreductase [Deltaproteobacteria bacterium]